VRVTQTGFERPVAALLRIVGVGWERALGWLKMLLEK
jgi:hypothetical protein